MFVMFIKHVVTIDDYFCKYSLNCCRWEISGNQRMLSFLQEGESMAAGADTFSKSLSPLPSSSLALSRFSFRSSLSAFLF